MVRLVAEKISNVQARPVAIGADAKGKTIYDPAAIRVTWDSQWDDKHYQVYVNGELAGVSTTIEQRSMIVFARPQRSAARIEVFAVAANDADTDLSQELPKVCRSARIQVKWLRSQTLPIEAMIDVLCDYGTGTLDETRPLNKEPIHVWPRMYEKCGHGLAQMGRSDFGFDGNASTGFGAGAIGLGEMGLDAEMMTWVSGELEPGIYKIAMRVRNGDGGTAYISATSTVHISERKEYISGIHLGSFDQLSNVLTLDIVRRN